MFHEFKKISKSNLIFYIVLLFVLVSRLPSMLKNFKAEGEVIATTEVKNLVSNLSVEFPPSKSPAVVIFWATWCGPCRIEMDRLARSVESGKIPNERIYALNLFESPDVILKHLKKNPYPFQFVEVPPHDWQIEMTPTMLLLENGKILSQSTGFSLLGIWRAEWLF